MTNPEGLAYRRKAAQNAGLTKKHNPMSWYWNEISDKDSAADATRTAVVVSYVIAGLTALLAILSVATRKSIFGLNGYSLVDAGLFAIAGWRISKLSRAWAVVALALYLIETVASISTRGFGFGVVTIIFILAYINAIRGTFAYHRYAQTEAPDSSQPSLG